ncbi:MAG TPA: glycosyltransferase 87 family protein [Myxococcales bacterium]|nr:glycosyltransferase 87 family protein [Myxococcales bacterium]
MIGPKSWVGGAVLGLSLFAFGLIRPDDGTVPFFVLLALAAAGYFATLHQVAKGLRPSRRALIACAALALAWRIPMLLAPPEPAADVRRYVWDARLVRAGLSPYTVVPADPAFAHLRTSESWPLNNPQVSSPYPPGAQLFFLAATALSESARAIKVAALVCDALLAFVVWRSLLAGGANPGWVLAYLWSPLVSLEVARHGHVDVAGALCLALAAFALVRGRALSGSIAFAISVAVKPLPIVLLPLLWRRVSRRHLVAGLAVLLALYLPFRDPHRLPLGSLPDVVESFRFNGPIFQALAPLAGPAAATAFAIAVGLAVAAWARRRLPLASPQAWAWPMAAALLCAPMIYPWYLVWLAPFLVTRETMPLAIWTVSILSTYVAWQLKGVGWVVPAWALLVEYGALVCAAAWLWRRNRPRLGTELSSSSAPPSAGAP